MRDDVTLFTIGHSTRSIDEFIEVLNAHGVKRLIDVRTIPRSRKNPQFGKESLARSVRSAGMTYRHVKALGGLRRTGRDSPNKGWRNESFRGYADYMQTPEFQAAIEDLVQRAKHSDAAVMCAEAVPWRCHRSLIGDAMTVRGIRVLDIMSRTSAKLHTLTSFAKVDGLQITYPES